MTLHADRIAARGREFGGIDYFAWEDVVAARRRGARCGRAGGFSCAVRDVCAVTAFASNSAVGKKRRSIFIFGSDLRCLRIAGVTGEA